jgi:hypothetical protein
MDFVEVDKMLPLKSDMLSHVPILNTDEGSKLKYTFQHIVQYRML